MLKTEYIDNFEVFYEKAGKHFEEHYEGCEAYRAENKGLNLNKKVFQQMIDLGTMNFFLLKEEEDILGYVNVSINLNPLFDEPQAVIDYLYILPEYRKNNYASKAIEEIEKELVSEGVKELNIMLPDKEYSENVAKGLGYSKTSTIYTKCLGE